MRLIGWSVLALLVTGCDDSYDVADPASYSTEFGLAPGRMTGGGSILPLGTSMRITHGFTLHCDLDDGPNRLQINWPDHRFHLEGLTDVQCTNRPGVDPYPPLAPLNEMYLEGFGRLNGEPASLVAVLRDGGEPGTMDHFAFRMVDDQGEPVISATGMLENGNHQAHFETP